MGRALLITASCLALAAGGCGFQAELPAAVPGLTLSELEDIQNDERLTADERSERIREAVGAPNNDEGDRLVDFLDTLSVP